MKASLTSCTGADSSASLSSPYTKSTVRRPILPKLRCLTFLPGILVECERELRARLTPSQTDCESSEPEVEYHPLTPPPSEHSESRPLSPSHSPSLIPVSTILVSSPGKEKESSSVGLRKRESGCSFFGEPLPISIKPRCGP